MRGRSGAVRVRKPLSYEKKKNLAGLLFILPWAVGTVFFFLKPFISSVVYSFSRVDYTTNTVVPVGLEHYMQAFTKDAEFLRRVTSSWSSLLYQVPLIVLFSLFIAIILNQKFIGRTVMRGIFFLPVIIASGIVLSIIQGDVFSDTIMSSMSSGKLFQADFMRQLLYESGLNESLVSTVTTAIDNIVHRRPAECFAADVRGGKNRGGDRLGVVLENHLPDHFADYHCQSGLHHHGLHDRYRQSHHAVYPVGH